MTALNLSLVSRLAIARENCEAHERASRVQSYKCSAAVFMRSFASAHAVEMGVINAIIDLDNSGAAELTALHIEASSIEMDKRAMYRFNDMERRVRQNDIYREQRLAKARADQAKLAA